jgi:methionine synthase II (cobalamin-independent)
MIPTKVHFVGSIGLDSVKEVFKTLGSTLGTRLRRVPDGEPGGRRAWIGWQQVVLRLNPFLRFDPESQSATIHTPLMILAEGVKPREVSFSELGYAHEARASYQLFREARKSGDIPKGVRFQVSLPAPSAVISTFIAPQDFLAVEKPYERAMLREVEEICAAIPHKELCIQWDVCQEMLTWDGQTEVFKLPYANQESAILARLNRLCKSIPNDVELGLHLCYGDFNGRHIVEPRDMAKLVGIANAVSNRVARQINYIHMPVPIARNDDAYFRPLANLALKRNTELYLGVVHDDGAKNIKARIAAAAKYIPSFGIATECGIARARKPSVVKKLIKAHAAASQEA